MVTPETYVPQNHLRRLKWRKTRDRIIELGLLASGLVAVFVTVSIAIILVTESLPFFAKVSMKEFLTDTLWTPMFDNPHFGILPLVAGTLVTTMVALLLAIPCGTIIAIYLSEFASHRTRETIKPMLELLGAVPTVVYGYFALMMVTPFLQSFSLTCKQRVTERLWQPHLCSANCLSAQMQVHYSFLRVHAGKIQP
jgi:phosphate transport system permease protein